jgi:hypothetical protein
VLVVAECIVTRLLVHHNQACLLLRIPAEEIRESSYIPFIVPSNFSRMRSSNPDTSRSLVKGIPNTTDTGFA